MSDDKDLLYLDTESDIGNIYRERLVHIETTK